MKKFFAALLAMIMVLSLVPATIFATEAVCPGEDETHNADNCKATAVETKEAECDAWGYTIYKCDTCGAQYADDFVKGDAAHDWDEGEVTTEPDCDTEGVKTYTCTTCGDTKTESIDELGHKWEVAEGIGCAAKQVCTVCDAVKAAGEHTWGDYPSAILEEPYVDVNGRPVDGLAEYTCVDCGDVKQVIIICEHDHKVELKSEAIAPDCVTDGQYAIYWCAVCQKEYLDKNGVTLIEDEDDKVNPKLGHELSEPIAIEGEPCHYQVKCLRKGCAYTEEKIDIHPEEDVAGVHSEEATCTKFGYELWACKNCGDTWSDSTPPTGHNEVTVVVEGTCTYPGYTFTYCANENCDVYKLEGYFTATDTENPEDYYRFTDKAAKEYGLTSYSVYVENEDGDQVKVHLISIADTAINADYHEDGANLAEKLVQAPTCYASGVTAHYCVLCGLYELETVSALGHKFATEYDEENEFITDYEAPSCEEGGSFYALCENGCGIGKKVELGEAGHDWVLDSKGYDCDISWNEEEGYYYYADEYYHCAVCQDEKVVLVPSEELTLPSYFKTVEDALKVHFWGNDYYNEEGEIVDQDGDRDNMIYPLDPDDAEYIYNAPTCTEVGYQTYACGNCGHCFFVEIPMVDHATENEDNMIDEVPNTCYEDGVKAHSICDACGVKHIDGKVVTDADLVIPAKHLGFYGKYFTMNKVHSSCVDPDWDAFNAALEALPEDATQLEALNVYSFFGFGLTQDVTVCYTCGSLFNDEDCTEPVFMIRWILEYPGHWMESVAGEEATCQNSGLVAGEYCTKPGCGYHSESLVDFEIKFNKDETVKSVTYEQTVIPAFNHTYNADLHDNEGTAIVEVDAHNPKCPCKRDDHHSCDKITYTHKMCELCKKEWIVDYVAAAEGHTNKAGELIPDICNPAEDADRHCVICDKDIYAKNHDLVIVEVGATCLEDAYVLEYCKNCDYRKVTESEIELADADKYHDYLLDSYDSYVNGDAESYDKNLVVVEESGLMYCALCQKPLNKCVVFKAESSNIADDEMATDGALIELEVSINASELDVWGIKFGVAYNPYVVEFVGAEYVSEGFDKYQVNNNMNYFDIEGDDGESEQVLIPYAVVAVAGSSDEGVLVNGEQVVVKLTFKVNNLVEASEAWFDIVFDVIEKEDETIIDAAIDADGAYYLVAGIDEVVDLGIFLDVDGDGVAATLKDAKCLYEMIGLNYSALADTDFDGEITIKDLLNLYNVMVGKTTADELLGRDPADFPILPA